MTHTDTERQQMVALVRRTIEHGLQHHTPATATAEQHPPFLHQPGACFITLELDHHLRGCIGSLEAHRSLLDDLLANGFAAAFRDPRFPPLGAEEYPRCTIKISLLSRPEPLTFRSESDLLRQLQPGIDGLILSDRTHRGTFLPSVWEQLPEPHQFLQQLKRKAGLAGDYWSESLRVERYRTEQFSYQSL